ncbi:DNA-binding response regulator [Actinoplanes ianthinogenes]|uniref:DNA-binding response regulator n=1 Tax=Actinoplanes ianthinogenes TaxID=122358 RepID=A0ABN6CTT0_9ACTN|nr:response regulator transcription factor [Actinoplanes ianthinogenes]BCJ47732.1 DNA-binding response regulator [Actinoplanes ianthinogenes]GGR03784.1 DNA-binding response regulator [Actinoplanes ianthinogenes]
MGPVSPPDGRRIVDTQPLEPLRAELTRPVVLLVDDDADLVTMAEAFLHRDGFTLWTAGDARGAAALLREHPIDLLVLDLGLPDGNGLDFLRGVRAGRHLPVIIVTGWAEERERVVGLELGADDYVVKPVSLPELAARIRAVLRRTRAPADRPVHEFGRLTIDNRSREATVDGERLALTPLEYTLLAFLAAAPRQVFSAGQLLTHVWGTEPGREDHSAIAEHVYRIRRKLTAAGVTTPKIVTVRRVGYRLDP